MAPDELIMGKQNRHAVYLSLDEFDNELGSGICSCEQDCSSRGDHDCEFFGKLPRHRLVRCLAVLYLAARKLPKSAVTLTERSLADKVSTTVCYDGGDYANRHPNALTFERARAQGVTIYALCFVAQA